jgi:hypothetical protein
MVVGLSASGSVAPVVLALREVTTALREAAV